MGTLSDQLLAQGQKLGQLQGEKSGFQRGLAYKEKEAAQNMYRHTIPTDMITKVLKIPEEKVRSYIADLKQC